MKFSPSNQTLGACVLLAALVSSSAEARRDQRREVRQQGRIGQGVRSGELTHKEAAGLRAGQRHVDRVQRRSKMDDGVVDAREARRIEKIQDRQSKAIYKQKHDDQQRPAAGQPSAQPPVQAPVEAAPVDASAPE